MMKRQGLTLLVAMASLLGGCSGEAPTPNPTINVTPSMTPTASEIEVTPTPTPTQSPTGNPTPSESQTATPTPTSGDTPVEDPRFLDRDGDGFSPDQGDCDDDDPGRRPGASEGEDTDGDGIREGNGIDNNCNNLVDDGTDQYDDDHDGFTEADGDCDDSTTLTRPGAEERCDGEDNDCDGRRDEDGDGDFPCVTASVECEAMTTDETCTTHDDCSDESALCFDGACQVADCDTSASSSSGVHEGGAGDGYACTLDEDCPLGAYCAGGVCASDCVDDGACDQGRFCTPRGKCGSCAFDDDCGDGELCTADGQCVTPECNIDDDCNEGFCGFNQQCVPHSMTSVPEPLRAQFVDCDPWEDDGEAYFLGQIDLLQGQDETQVCLVLAHEEGLEPDTGLTVAVAVFSGQSALGIGTEIPIIELDFAGAPNAVYSDTLKSWTVDLAPGSTTPLFIQRLGDEDLGYDGASPTIVVSSEVRPTQLRVNVSGGWGGAFTGRIHPSGSIRSAQPFAILVDPANGGDGTHQAVILGSASATGSGDNLKATFTELEEPGHFSILWHESIDLPSLSAALGQPSLRDPLVDRVIYRRIELVGSEDEGGLFTGTMNETIRGLLPIDLTFTGTFAMEASPSLSIRYEDEIADSGDTLWSDASDDAQGFTSGELDPSTTIDDACDGAYNQGPTGLDHARCLVDGDSGDCGFEGSAYPLLDYLAGVEAEFGDESPGYTDARYASYGACDVELGLYFDALQDAGAYNSGNPLVSGMGCGLTDGGTQACCVDANRLRCAAEEYSVLNTFGTSETRKDASYEVWEPLSALVGAYAYDLEDRRVRDLGSELERQDGTLTPFSLSDKIETLATQTASPMPGLQTLLTPTVATILGNIEPNGLETCDFINSGRCPYEAFLYDLSGLVAAHQQSLTTLGALWVSEDVEIGEATPTLEKLRWIATNSYVTMALTAYLAELAPSELDSGLQSRLKQVSVQGNRTLTLARQGVRGTNPWGYPKGYIPNPTSDEGSFSERLAFAVSAVESAAQEEREALGWSAGGANTRRENLEDLQARLSEILTSHIEICGGNEDDTLNGDRCGTRLGDGDMAEALAAAEEAFNDYDLAELELTNLVEQIRIKKGEAGATLAAYQNLAQSHQANHEQLIVDLESIQDDYLIGWEERFTDYQENKAELYDQLEALYADLAVEVESALIEAQGDRQEALKAQCTAVKTAVEEKQAETMEAISDQCDYIVSCLEQAEKELGKRRKEAEKKKQRLDFIQNSGKCASGQVDGCKNAWEDLTGSSGDSGGGCGERCREEANCTAKQEIAEAEGDANLAEQEALCTAEAENLAIDFQERLNENLWEREKEQLALMLEEENGRLQDWYDYREERMRFQIERLENAAVFAAQHANQQAGVTANVELTRAGFRSEIQMLLTNLKEGVARLEQAEAAIDAKLERITTLRSLADGLWEQRVELDRILDEANFTDPSLRLVDSPSVRALNGWIDRARERTWLAMRAYEFETSTNFSQAQVVSQAQSSEQLCDVLTCLADSYRNYVDAFSDSAPGRSRIVSLREVLGLGEARVDIYTGDRLTPGQRFGAYFSSPGQLFWEESNQAFTWAVSMQTHSRPGNAWNWDGERCNEKIESIQVLIVCDGCSPNETAEVRVAAQGAMLSHSCRGEDLPTFLAPGGVLKTATLNANFTAPPEGDYLSIPRTVWDETQANTELAGLNPIVSGWSVRLLPAVISPLNEELAVDAIEDIILRINYSDQSADVWGGSDRAEAMCLTETETTYNDDPDWSCNLPL